MTDLRIKKSQRALLDASFQVLLHNPHASLSEIASQANVGRATLYRHFPTRESLITAISVESLEIVKDAILPIISSDNQGEAAIRKLIAALLPLADRFHFLQMVWTLVEMDQEFLNLYEKQMETVKQWIEQGQRQGEINADLTPEWVVSVLDSLLYSASWMLAQGAMNKDDVEQQLVHTLLRGIQRS
ncbi:TetR/AcrR family transcriptional regulator [Neptuniibacter sp. SY11_33]|uniref:TetR/AcrR family transcriptional regulator n=1 Tax=Neptuniibacter sp. SY11_33 TaxID=3398215 RepID=UPI0039F4F664